jgi:hypothetical protein
MEELNGNLARARAQLEMITKVQFRMQRMISQIKEQAYWMVMHLVTLLKRTMIVIHLEVRS